MDGAISRRNLLKSAAAGTAAAAVPAAAAKAAQGEQRVKVVVVGAGLAGLYAADQLKRRRSLVVLEASDRVGGRVLNLKVGPRPNDITEAGGEWLAPGQRIAHQLVRRFRLKTFKSYTKGKSTLIVDGKVKRFSGPIAPFPDDVGIELAGAIAELTAMAAEVPVRAPWNAPSAVEWDNQTAQSWIEQNLSSRLAQQFAGILLGGPVSVAPQDLSLLHYLFITQAGGGPANFTTLGEGILSDRVVGGTGRFVDGLAGPMQELIRLNTPVTTIEQGARSVRVTTPNGTWVADHVIVAMSPTMTQRIRIDPLPPVSRLQSVQRTGNGSCIKAFPVYRTAFWRAQGLNGVVQSNSTPFPAVFDNSPPDGSPGVLFALIENVEARRLSQVSPARRKAEVLNGLALAFGEQARHPIRYLEFNWCNEPWAQGGAAAFFAPGLLTEYRYLFDKPIGRVHFAGTETGRAFWGNMESALQSGERAAREVLRG
jgi:monoamine oxidase